jgi:uncharacterized iron-regulated membrane protein
MRTLFRQIHLIVALVVGLVAAAVGLSGSVLTFREEIEHALYRPRVAPQIKGNWNNGYVQAVAISEAEKRRIAVIVLPQRDDEPLEFVTSLRGARSLKEADQTSIYANQYTGEIVGQRRRNDSFIAWLRDLHFALFAGVTGLKVNGYCALGLIFVTLTGFVLWWQTNAKGKALAVNWKASWKRSLWDLHRVIGIVALAFLLLVALTGAYYPFRETVQGWFTKAGTALPPRGTPAAKPVADATAKPLTFGEIVAKAQASQPNARLAVLRPPAAPTQTWAATFHRGSESGESVDSGATAYLDPLTGELIRLDDVSQMAFGARLLKSIEPLHFGKYAGLPHKLLWFVLGLTPAFFFGSGVVMWWNRTRGARRVRNE